jgi:hypothetical protein
MRLLGLAYRTSPTRPDVSSTRGANAASLLMEFPSHVNAHSRLAVQPCTFRAHFVHILPANGGYRWALPGDKTRGRRAFPASAAGHARACRILYQNVNRLLPAAI